jgi:dipeptidyl-peptidase-4
VYVGGDGERVVFLRAARERAGAQLWVYDVGGATGRLLVDARDLPGGPGGIGRYATDATARAAVFAPGGRLHHADLLTGELSVLPTPVPVTDPRLDPTGRWIGYLAGGSLRVCPAGARAHAPGGDQPADLLLAGEPDPSHGGQRHISWGRAGWWWAPDGTSVLAVRTDTAPPRPQVSLHLLDLGGGWVDVHWDRETYPHLASVCWSDHGSPVVAVLRRSQQHGLVLAVDPRTGETQVHAELADPRWVEPIPGTPRHLPDGRVLVGGELAHDGYDARCLFADGTLLTPPTLYVRRVVGRLPTATELLVEASGTEPSEQHLYRVGTSVGAGGIDARPLTSAPGWHRAEVGGNTLVIGSDSLDHAGTRWAVWRGGTLAGELAPPVPTPRHTPRPAVQRVTDRRLPTGVLYPEAHVSGRRLPVLVLAGGLRQTVRAARAAWVSGQRLADAGFAVVMIDHRGTPGVAPSFEKVVYRRLLDLALADLTDALVALTGKHTDLDLDRVAVAGTGVGGWLAGMAALRRPETFRCAVARAPLVDWVGSDHLLGERYLGPPDEDADIYAHHCLVTAATDAAEAAPLLLVPDAATAPAVAHLAAALHAAGHRHTVLPAHATDEQVRRAERDFLRRHTAGPDR